MILFAIGRHIERESDEVGLLVRCSRELFENAEQNALFIKGLSYPGIDDIYALRVACRESAVLTGDMAHRFITELRMWDREFTRLNEATLREFDIDLSEGIGGVELDVSCENRQVGFRLVGVESPYQSTRFVLGNL